MLRVLMINYEFPPIGGGGGQACRELLRVFSQRDDLAVDVVTSGIADCEPVEQLGRRIRIHRIPLQKANLHYWQKREVISWLFHARSLVKRLMKDQQYDLGHGFFGFPSGGLCYARRKQLPYIISLRGSDVPGFNNRLSLDYRLLAGYFRRIWRNAAEVIANSEGLARLARSFTPEVPISVIPNGVDTTLFRPDDNQRWYPNRPAQENNPAGTCPLYPAFAADRPVFRLLVVGRLIARKRINAILQALRQLKEQAIPAGLTIAGDGNLLGSLQQQARAMAVADRVVFLGRVPREAMVALYRGHDALVTASQHEGMSNAMLEGMACGLPMLTVRCEGVQELVENGQQGLLLDEPVSHTLAQAVATLVDHSEQLTAMRQQAVAKAETMSWDQVAQAYIVAYHNAVVNYHTPNHHHQATS